MRRTLFATALLIPFTLTACGEGGAIDANLKSTVRQSLIASCNATAQGQIPEGVDVDVSTICTCATDKVLAEKSVNDLVVNPPTLSEAMDKVKACVSEIGPVTIAPPAE